MKKLTILLIVQAIFIIQSPCKEIESGIKGLSRSILEALYEKVEDPKGLKLAVFEFTYYDGHKNSATQKIQERLSGYLSRDKKIYVLERQFIGKALEEKKLQMFGLIDESEGAEFGKLLGANIVIFGIIEDLEDNKSEISARMIEVKTGRILAAEMIEVKRSWQRYTPKLKEENEKQNQAYEYKIEFTPTKLTNIEIPQMKPLPKLDMRMDEIEKIEAYDEMMRIDESDMDPDEKVKKWLEFGGKFNDYEKYSFERANFWKEYKIKQKEYNDYIEKRDASMKKDFEKLLRLLKLNVLKPKQKDELLEKFYQAYDYDLKKNYQDRLFEFEVKPCIKDKKFGFCYYDGSVLIEPKYDYVKAFKEGLAVVFVNGKYGYVDKAGQSIIPPKYALAESFSQGLAAVCLNNKCGYVDRSGKEVIGLKYEVALSFSDGLSAVKMNGKWGYIDKNGVEVVPGRYSNASSFSENIASVYSNGRWGAIDKTGKEIVKPKYEYLGPFSGGIAKIKINSKWGYIDKTGKEIISPKYDYARTFSENLAWVKLNDKWICIDSSGGEVIPSKYSDAGPFDGGIAAVCLNGKYGFIDKTESVVIPLKYDTVGVFSEGLALIELNGKWGYIDRNGKEVISPKYDEAHTFSDGLASIHLKGAACYVGNSCHDRDCYIDHFGNDSCD